MHIHTHIIIEYPQDIKASCSNKRFVVRFTSAYHGHISGVGFLDCPEHIFLPECSQYSIDFIERYHYVSSIWYALFGDMMLLRYWVFVILSVAR